MKVLHFNSQSDRDTWNTRGLPLGKDDVTRQLFPVVREKQGARRFGVLIPDNEESKLTGPERAALHNPFAEEDYERE